MMKNPLNEGLYTEWQRARKGEGYAELPRNRRALELLEEHAGGADLTTLGKGRIRDWVGSMDGMATSSRLSYFSSARAFYNFAVADEIIPASPMAGLSEPKSPRMPVPVPADDDVRRLIAACEADKTPMGIRDRALVRVMIDTGGPRATEVATMLIRGLAPAAADALLGADLSADTITVRGKGGKIRTWPISARTARAVSHWVRARSRLPAAQQPRPGVPAAPWLWLPFRAPAGTAMTRSGVRQLLGRRCAQAGIGLIHPHQLRHFSYHHFLLAGGQLNDAKVLYGWDDDAMPQRYAAALADQRALRSGHALAIGDQW